MIERNEQERNFALWRSSEVHILDGENQSIRVMTVMQPNTDEVFIEIIEDREIKPKSMYKL